MEHIKEKNMKEKTMCLRLRGTNFAVCGEILHADWVVNEHLVTCEECKAILVEKAKD